ncbi:MAG: SPOR domain-containing protein [Gammaproteobacteria bacterium]|nr:SPOR domain-containing protein [Gammaproteobacteria bacterium]MCP5136692.1 SPOR domain-containing protein [Gammaproteobacteria bacterium]
MRADFKDTHPSMPKKRAGKRGSERPKSKRGATAHKAGHAGWPWLLAGLLIGLFVAFLWYLTHHAPSLPPAPVRTEKPVVPASPVAPPTHKPTTVVPRAEPSKPVSLPASPPTTQPSIPPAREPVEQASPKPQSEPEAASQTGSASGEAASPAEAKTDSTPPADAPSGQDWRFYQLLEEAEVDVPVPQIRAPRAEKAPDPTQRMALQTGSFRNIADAERMKAQLALLGYHAQIVATQSDSAGTWHRVRLGPYDDARKLGKDRAALYSHNIESLPIKLDP